MSSSVINSLIDSGNYSEDEANRLASTVETNLPRSMPIPVPEEKPTAPLVPAAPMATFEYIRPRDKFIFSREATNLFEAYRLNSSTTLSDKQVAAATKWGPVNSWPEEVRKELGVDLPGYDKASPVQRAQVLLGSSSPEAMYQLRDIEANPELKTQAEESYEKAIDKMHGVLDAGLAKAADTPQGRALLRQIGTDLNKADSGIGNLFKNFAAGAEGATTSAIAGGAAGGLMAGYAVARGLEWLTNNKDSELSKLFAESVDMVAEYGEPRHGTYKEGFLGEFASGLGSTVPTLAAYAINPLFGKAVMAGIAVDDTKGDVKFSEGDDQLLKIAVMAVSVPAYVALEQLNFDRILGMGRNLFANTGKQLFGTAVTGAITESAQYVVGFPYQAAFDPGFNATDFFTAAGKEGMMGGVISPFLGTITSIGPKVMAYRNEAIFKRLFGDVSDQITRILELGDASAIASARYNLVEVVRQKNLPATIVVAARSIDSQAYLQEAGITPEEHREAVATDSDYRLDTVTALMASARAQIEQGIPRGSTEHDVKEQAGISQKIIDGTITKDEFVNYMKKRFQERQTKTETEEQRAEREANEFLKAHGEADLAGPLDVDIEEKWNLVESVINETAPLDRLAEIRERIGNSTASVAEMDWYYSEESRAAQTSEVNTVLSEMDRDSSTEFVEETAEERDNREARELAEAATGNVVSEAAGVRSVGGTPDTLAGVQSAGGDMVSFSQGKSSGVQVQRLGSNIAKKSEAEIKLDRSKVHNDVRNLVRKEYGKEPTTIEEVKQLELPQAILDLVIERHIDKGGEAFDNAVDADVETETFNWHNQVARAYNLIPDIRYSNKGMPAKRQVSYLRGRGRPTGPQTEAQKVDRAARQERRDALIERQKAKLAKTLRRSGMSEGDVQNTLAKWESAKRGKIVTSATAGVDESVQDARKRAALSEVERKAKIKDEVEAYRENVRRGRIASIEAQKVRAKVADSVLDIDKIKPIANQYRPDTGSDIPTLGRIKSTEQQMANIVADMEAGTDYAELNQSKFIKKLRAQLLSIFNDADYVSSTLMLAKSMIVRLSSEAESMSALEYADTIFLNTGIAAGFARQLIDGATTLSKVREAEVQAEANKAYKKFKKKEEATLGEPGDMLATREDAVFGTTLDGKHELAAVWGNNSGWGMSELEAKYGTEFVQAIPSIVEIQYTTSKSGNTLSWKTKEGTLKAKRFNPGGPFVITGYTKVEAPAAPVVVPEAVAHAMSQTEIEGEYRPALQMYLEYRLSKGEDITDLDTYVGRVTSAIDAAQGFEELVASLTTENFAQRSSMFGLGNLDFEAAKDLISAQAAMFREFWQHPQFETALDVMRTMYQTAKDTSQKARWWNKLKKDRPQFGPKELQKRVYEIILDVLTPEMDRRKAIDKAAGVVSDYSHIEKNIEVYTDTITRMLEWYAFNVYKTDGGLRHPYEILSIVQFYSFTGDSGVGASKVSAGQYDDSYKAISLYSAYLENRQGLDAITSMLDTLVHELNHALNYEYGDVLGKHPNKTISTIFATTPFVAQLKTNLKPAPNDVVGKALQRLADGLGGINNSSLSQEEQRATAFEDAAHRKLTQYTNREDILTDRGINRYQTDATVLAIALKRASKDIVAQSEGILNTLLSVNVPMLEFIDKAIRFQKVKEDIRGMLTKLGPRMYNITMKGGSFDYSTFPHEFFHMYVDLARTDAPDIYGYLDRLSEGKLGSSDEKVIREAEEKLARQWEIYLLQGKAPSMELRQVFNSYTKWLSSIAGNNTDAINGQLSGLFDTLVATEQQVEAALRANGLTQQYINLFEEITEAAKKARVKRKKAELTAAERLRKVILGSYMKASGESEAIGRQVANQVNSQPIVMLYNTLKEETDAVDLNKLRAKTKPNNLLDTIKDVGLFQEVLEANGYNANDMVTVLKDLRSMKTPGQQVTAGVREAVTARAAELAKSLQISDDLVAESVHNEDTSVHLDILQEVINEQIGLKESKRRDVAARRYEDNIVKDAARRLIGKETLGNAGNIRQFISEYERNIKAYYDNARQAKLEEAADAMRRARVSHFKITEALKASKLQQAIRGLASNKYTRQLNHMRQNQYTKAIDVLRSAYGLSGEELAEGTKSIEFTPRGGSEESGFNTLLQDPNTILPIRLKTLQDRVDSYKDMTVDQAYELRDAINILEKSAKIDTKLFTQEKYRDAKIMLDDMLRRLGSRTRPADYSRGHWYNRAFDWLSTYSLTTETIMQEADGYSNYAGEGYGPFMTMLQAVRERGAAAAAMNVRFAERLGEHWGTLQKWVDTFDPSLYGPTPDILTKLHGGSTEFSAEEILMIALNSGNAGNLNNLLEGNNISHEQLVDIMNQFGSKELAAIQGIWDVMSELFEPANEVKEKVLGIRTEKIQLVGNTYAHGKVRGGYFPLVADKVSVRGARFFEVLFPSITRDAPSFLHERTGTIYATKLDRSVLANYVYAATQFINTAEIFDTVDKVLGDRQLSSAFIGRFGIKTYNNLLNHFGTAADPSSMLGNSQSGASKLLEYLRSAAIVGSIGLRLGSAIKQRLDMMPSFVLMNNQNRGSSAENATALVRAVKEMGILGNLGFSSGKIKEIYGKSEVLQERDRRLDQNLSYVLDTAVKGTPYKIAGVPVSKASANRLFFGLLRSQDRAGVAAIWSAQYALSRNGRGTFDTTGLSSAEIEKRAIRDADSIITTFASGATMDLTAAQRDATLRVFTTFMSSVVRIPGRMYTYTQAYRAGKMTEASYIASMASEIYSPVIAGYLVDLMIKSLFGMDDEDKERAKQKYQWYDLPKDLLLPVYERATQGIPVVNMLSGIPRMGIYAATPASMSGPVTAYQNLMQAGKAFNEGRYGKAALKAASTAGFVTKVPIDRPSKDVKKLMERLGWYKER